MIPERIKRLEYLCQSLPGRFAQFSEDEFCSSPGPGRWSKKQILGHLIDSAANNHQRFIRAQFEDVPFIVYDQNKWNEFSYHDKTQTSQLISFWYFYNMQLAHLARHIPEENWKRLCSMGGPDPVSLEFVFDDYVSHLEHHLTQIVAFY
ncbi:MAG: DinB family protein [Bacteroidota bacterium]